MTGKTVCQIDNCFLNLQSFLDILHLSQADIRNWSRGLTWFG